MSWIIVGFVLLFLIFINGLYVAAEFSTISVRHARLAQLAADGNRVAHGLLQIVRDRRKLDTYIASCQVGITATSLVMGFYAQNQLSRFLLPFLVERFDLTEATASSFTTTFILILITSLQVTLAELLPKTLGIQYPERYSLWTAIPMRWSMAFFRPLIWLFNGSGQLILRLLGQGDIKENVHLHEPSEILLMVEESSAGGLLDHEERRLLKNSLELRRLTVEQVMAPRTTMLAASINLGHRDLMRILANSPYSRLPVYENNIDNIRGIVHLKDLLCIDSLPKPSPVQELLRPVIFVPESMPVDQVLAQLQRKKIHMAIVLDEYGGTAGVVTLEDLIEELFGELTDEFDQETIPSFRAIGDDRLQVRGDVSVDDLNEVLNLILENDNVNTLGGLILSQLGRVPQEGEEVAVSDVVFRVEAMDGNRISLLSLASSPEQIQKVEQEWAQWNS